MTVAEAAKELGCSTRLIYKLCKHKKLTFCRLGFGRGRVDISAFQLEAYRQSCEVIAAPDGEAVPQRRTPRGLSGRDYVAEYRARKATKTHRA